MPVIPTISIHAPREGSDAAVLKISIPRGQISIHAPREGSDQIRLLLLPPSKVFLSTLPARGATQGAVAHLAVGSISIHAPREGSDRCPAGRRR